MLIFSDRSISNAFCKINTTSYSYGSTYANYILYIVLINSSDKILTYLIVDPETIQNFNTCIFTNFMLSD